jgi:hypothetical protein
MFTLIKREIQDHLTYFIGAVVFSAVLIAMSISLIHKYDPKDPPLFSTGLGIPVAIIVMLVFYAMGATQMYIDRTRNISALLSTLAVSRSRILLARIIAGVLAILTLLAPLTIAAAILSRIFNSPISMYPGMVLEISITALLIAFACYCIGLQTGWNSNPITPSLGGLALTCILVSLILVKGFGLHIVIILLLFIVASLVRTWHTFMSTSL